MKVDTRSMGTFIAKPPGLSPNKLNQMIRELDAQQIETIAKKITNETLALKAQISQFLQSQNILTTEDVRKTFRSGQEFMAELKSSLQPENFDTREDSQLKKFYQTELTHAFSLGADQTSTTFVLPRCPKDFINIGKDPRLDLFVLSPMRVDISAEITDLNALAFSVNFTILDESIAQSSWTLHASSL